MDPQRLATGHCECPRPRLWHALYTGRRHECLFQRCDRGIAAMFVLLPLLLMALDRLTRYRYRFTSVILLALLANKIAKELLGHGTVLATSFIKRCSSSA